MGDDDLCGISLALARGMKRERKRGEEGRRGRENSVFSLPDSALLSAESVPHAGGL